MLLAEYFLHDEGYRQPRSELYLFGNGGGIVRLIEVKDNFYSDHFHHRSTVLNDVVVMSYGYRICKRPGNECKT